MNPNIDKRVIDILMSNCNISEFGPGALLYNPNVSSLNTQLEFLENILIKLSPRTVLETGTESGMFSYFVKCVIPTVNVTTFGLENLSDERSKKCVDFLNEKFGKYISYIAGDSTQTLSDFNPDYSIEFAWIDGGHYDDVPYKDLMNCDRLQIPDICLDDYNLIPEVRQSLERFLSECLNYSIVGSTNDERGICHLKRL